MKISLPIFKALNIVDIHNQNIPDTILNIINDHQDKFKKHKDFILECNKQFILAFDTKIKKITDNLEQLTDFKCFNDIF